jgi:hypothetical protein
VTQAGAITTLPGLRSRLLGFLRREWLLSASLLVWIVFLLNFEAFAVESGDEHVQFQFAARLYGDVHDAVGYYFGLGLVEAPFYGVGKLLDRAGLHTVYGNPVEQASVALGLGLLSILAWPLLSHVIRGLRLKAGGFAILAAALGTPYVYYVVFLPGKNHALDALLFTGVIWLSFRYFRVERPHRRLTLAIGVLFGFAYTVRYFDGAAAVMLVLLLLWWRRFGDAVTIAVTSACVCLLLFVIPWAYGVKVFSGGNYSAENILIFAPLNPLRMLFTNHRGYFVWSPVAALAVVGLVFLFRRRPEHRRFLTAVCAMSVGIMASYSLVAFWDGTWSFGQRFFTPLFPVVAIGLAGLIDAVPRFAIAAATVAVAWSLFLCFNLIVIGGPQYVSNTPGGATDVALIPARTNTSLGAYLWGMRYKSRIFK